MSKNNRNKLNLIFSSFLVIGYIICTYFFSSLASQVSGLIGTLIYVVVTVLFGLLLFYATRVGEGKQVKRFSLAVLLMVVVPSLFIILAGLINGFPLHDRIAPQGSSPSVVMILACIALGYGIPYTFFSGYEMASADADDDDDDNNDNGDEQFVYVDGGIAQELAASEKEEKKSSYDSAKYDKYL